MVRDGMDGPFDNSKSHFAAWLQGYDLDEDWFYFTPCLRHHGGSSLYYAAFCGLYDLAEHLIANHPEQINALCGRLVTPLPAALYKRHFRVADLLYQHSAVLDVRCNRRKTPLYCASMLGDVDILKWLFNIQSRR